MSDYDLDAQRWFAQGIQEGRRQAFKEAAEIANKWFYNAVLDRGRQYCIGWGEATVDIAAAIEAKAGEK